MAFNEWDAYTAPARALTLFEAGHLADVEELCDRTIKVLSPLVEVEHPSKPRRDSWQVRALSECLFIKGLTLIESDSRAESGALFSRALRAGKEAYVFPPLDGSRILTPQESKWESDERARSQAHAATEALIQSMRKQRAQERARTTRDNRGP